MQQRPVAIGVLLCEQVIIEETTRNYTPVNCFGRRVLGQFPSEPFPFVVLALLTDGLGDGSLEVVIHRLDNLEEIFRASEPCRFPTPLHVLRCTVRIRNCSFPVPGYYQVSLMADHELVAQRRLLIQ
jgi:hypothetical protein